MQPENPSTSLNWLELVRGREVLARAERVLRENPTASSSGAIYNTVVTMAGKEWPYAVLAEVEHALHYESGRVPGELARAFDGIQFDLTSCRDFDVGSRIYNVPGPNWALDLDPKWLDLRKHINWTELRQGRTWLALSATQIKKQVEAGEQRVPDEIELAFLLSGKHWVCVLIALVDDLLQNHGGDAICLSEILHTLSQVQKLSHVSGGAISGWIKP